MLCMLIVYFKYIPKTGLERGPVKDRGLAVHSPCDIDHILLDGAKVDH